MDDKLKVIKYKAAGLDVDFYPSLVEEPNTWFKQIKKHLPENKYGRKGVVYGDDNLVYIVKYGNNVKHKTVNSWNDIPGLTDIKRYCEHITGQIYTVCVIQHYYDGRAGINPHKDKEMVEGTKICGLSLGATRELVLARGNKKLTSSLGSGSLYVLNNPTNQHWSHSITKDESIKKSRISLTFRNY
jgi:alkylated DNA repair dioxygenase AlkB